MRVETQFFGMDVLLLCKYSRNWKKIEENKVSKTGIPSVYPAPTRDKGKNPRT